MIFLSFVLFFSSSRIFFLPIKSINLKIDLFLHAKARPQLKLLRLNRFPLYTAKNVNHDKNKHKVCVVIRPRILHI